MKVYLDLLRDIRDNGTGREDRTGTGTRALFGRQLHINLAEGFPLLTTKKVFLRGIIHELLWFVRGDTNIKYLVDNGVKIWNEWPYQRYLREQGRDSELPMHSEPWLEGLAQFVERIRQEEGFAERWGDLGPVYGRQWRNFNGIDQLQWVLREIKRNPDSRRLIVSAWNPADIEEMSKAGLPPCHTLYQFHVSPDGKLSCQLYQRSADVFLGVPFNIASYALLTLMVAHVSGLEPGEFVHTFGDVHIYNNHIDQVNEQLTRDTRALPKLKINPAVSDLFAFSFDDFTLEGYDPHPGIKAPIAV